MELIEEVARHFHNNGLGILATDLFYGFLPEVEENTSILVRDTGGVTPNVDILEIKHPTFQIFIRSKTYNAGKAKLGSVRDLLHGLINETLIPGGIYYRRIHALSEGGHIGKNDGGYHEFSMNFEVEMIE